MPMKPPRVCPKCKNIIRGGICKACKKQDDLKYNSNMRDNKSQSFYNSRSWKRIKDYRMSLDGGICTRCGYKADLVHHIKEIKEAPELALDIDNLESLCHKCHNKEHGGV